MEMKIIQLIQKAIFYITAAFLITYLIFQYCVCFSTLKDLDWHCKGPSINDVSSEGEGGKVQKWTILLTKKPAKGEGGGS